MKTKTITKPRKKNPINPHISLVKRWVAGEDISVNVLWANSKAADAAAAAARSAAVGAAAAAYDSAGWRAAYWVEEYEELTK